MGETDGEGIGLVRGGIMAEAEKCAGHEGDLLLPSTTFAGGGFFDEFGRIFVDREAGAGGGEEGGPPGGTEGDGGAGVLDVNDQLDGEGFGGVGLDQLRQAVVNLHQTGGGWAGGGDLDGAGGQDHRFFGRALQDGEAGAPKGGVDGQNSHGGIVPTGKKMSRERRLTGKKQEDKLWA